MKKKHIRLTKSRGEIDFFLKVDNWANREISQKFVDPHSEAVILENVHWWTSLEKSQSIEYINSQGYYIWHRLILKKELKFFKWKDYSHAISTRIYKYYKYKICHCRNQKMSISNREIQNIGQQL